ncbi:MAG: histidinol-phosphate transaminase [Candidatus Methanofishera endochildressiae]|uniref:Histidinol-phosphate aminotransferase n=1 Tax=Candidatus Methanofishera endochildressiae TaxID=2738884 RepID=A0A7Z0SDB4_9GAMM|nr:histidinol-phosphate transaminase [Candidatus Methanofishera endochildressiae]
MQHSIIQLATSGVQTLIPYQPGKPISELERELGLTEIVKLASNENPLGPSEKVRQAMQASFAELSRYPDGNGFALKSALAEKWKVDSKQITLGNGSNEILELLARAFLTTEHEVIFSQHAFAVYPLVTQAVGAQARVVPAVDYGHDLKAMLAVITEKTRLMFIANPNNPTGTYLTEQALSEFLAAVPEHVIVVLDEAYYEYVAKDDYPNSIAWLSLYPNLIITRTFSKAHGLAGLRVGYGLSSPEMADVLNRVRQPFNNNSLALAAAEVAIKDGDYLTETIALNNAGMQFLTTEFSSLGLSWIESVGNFVAVDLQREASSINTALLHKGVIVRPVANYEMPNHLRISIGMAAENEFFINALKAVLANV